MEIRELNAGSKVVATCYCVLIPNLTNGARTIDFETGGKKAFVKWFKD